MYEAIRTHKYLEVWKEAMQLMRNVYSLSQNLPEKEAHKPVTQYRKAVFSIPGNIAEGAAQTSRQRFLYAASDRAKEMFGIEAGGPLVLVGKQRRLLLGLMKSLRRAKEGRHG